MRNGTELGWARAVPWFLTLGLVHPAAVRPAAAGSGLEVVQSLPSPCGERVYYLASPALSPDGRHLYVRDVRALSWFARDLATGALVHVAKADLPGPSSAYLADLVLSPDGRHVYALQRESDGAGTLYVLDRDAATGSLTLTGYVDLDPSTPLADGSAVAISPDGAHVYMLGRNLDVFARDSLTGALTVVETQALDSSPSCLVLSPDGIHLYAAGSGSIVTLARNPLTGGATVTGQSEVIGGPTLPCREMTTSPDGVNLYLASSDSTLSAGKVTSFRRDPISGQLTQIGQMPPTVAGVVRAIAVSPDGLNVYTGTYGPGAVARFARSPIDGALTFQDARLDSDPVVDGIGSVLGVVVSADGAHVYATGSGAAAFEREVGTGALDFIDDIEPDGEPRGLVTSPDGARVHLLCERALKTFARDAMTGALGLTGVLELDERSDDAVSLAQAADGDTFYVTSVKRDNAARHLTVVRRDLGTGALAPIAVYAYSKDPDAIYCFDPHVSAVSPDGTNVYVLSCGLLSTFARDTGTGLLAPVDELHSADRNLGQWYALVLSPDGRHVYVGTFANDFDVLTDGIAIFDRDPATGRLAFVDAVPVAAGEGGELARPGVYQLAVSPDGLTVYAGFRGTQNGVAAYRRDPITGGLTLLPKAGVRDVAADDAMVMRPDGAYMYIAGFNLDIDRHAVGVLRSDEQSGVLGNAGAYLPQLGRHLAASSDGRNLYAVSHEAEYSPGALTTLATRPLCAPSALPACVTSTAGKVRVADRSPASDNLRWAWSGPGPVDLGDPRTTTELSLCVYDASARPQPVLSGVVPNGAECGDPECWRATGSGFRYKLKAGMPDGVVDLKVVVGGSRGKLLVKGRGPTLPPLELPWATPVTVQLQGSNGGCWEATFAAPLRTTDLQFQANR